MQFDSLAVGRVVRKLRVQKGVTQEVLSGFAVIGRTHLTMIERGTKQPNLETLWRIAQALDMKPSELVECIEAEMCKSRTEKEK